MTVTQNTYLDVVLPVQTALFGLLTVPVVILTNDWVTTICWSSITALCAVCKAWDAVEQFRKSTD